MHTRHMAVQHFPNTPPGALISSVTLAPTINLRTASKAMIIADRQGGGVDVINSGLVPQVAEQEDHQRHEDAFLQADEVLIAGHAGKGAAQQRLGEAVIEALEIFEA